MFPCTLPLKFHKDSFITPRAVLSLALFNGFRVLGLGLGPKGNNKPNGYGSKLGTPKIMDG